MMPSLRWYRAYAESHGLRPRMVAMSVAVMPWRRAACHSGDSGVTSISSGTVGFSQLGKAGEDGEADALEGGDLAALGGGAVVVADGGKGDLLAGLDFVGAAAVPRAGLRHWSILPRGFLARGTAQRGGRRCRGRR